MIPSADELLTIDPMGYRNAFDTQPFGFQHSLHKLPMFHPEALVRLAERYADKAQDFFVAASAATPGTKFYDVKHSMFKPHEALGQLGSSPVRVLLKRVENHDSEFRDLLHTLFDRLSELRGGLKGEKVMRLESSVFISSAASTTPFHFDPEINHFFQIEGPKNYHVFAPTAVDEADLERFYVKGVVDIGQLDLASCDPKQEHVFNLEPGRGFHQPQNAPHWVQTGTVRSISYAFVFETDASRERSSARSANHYLRMLGMKPQQPGVNPSSDHAKAAVMQVMTPMRQGVRKTVKQVLGR
ncbi:hypothetical protein LMIY3S_01308 [Labrys miyagiensis]